MASKHSDETFRLRDLPMASRVLLAAFLISVGVGYVSALVQLHVQHASPGNLLPTADDAVDAYHGSHGNSTLERLIVANETLPWNGTGSMRPAFTTRSPGWVRRIKDKAEAMKLDPKNPAHMKAAERELRKDRELEIESMVEWIKAGGKQKTYNEFVVSEKLASRFPEDLGTLGEDMFTRNDKNQVVAIVENIMHTRCVRCHKAGGSGSEGEIHLDRFDVIQDYLNIEYGGGMPLRKLAQSTHVHLLGFAMLYGLTGLIFSLTSYPAVVRLILAPFPLIMQLIDISFWWLARLPESQYGPEFAKGITVTGGLVAIGLLTHIVLGTLNLFGTKGRLVLIVLFTVGAAAGGMIYVKVVDPYLLSEALQGPIQ